MPGYRMWEPYLVLPSTSSVKSSSLPPFTIYATPISQEDDFVTVFHVFLLIIICLAFLQ